MRSLDMLRFLRRKKFWIAAAAVAMAAILIFVNLSNEKHHELQDMHALSKSYQNDEQLQFIDDLDFVDAVIETAEQLEKSIIQRDWHAINHNMAAMYLIEADRILAITAHDNPNLYYHDYLKHKDVIKAMLKEYHIPLLQDDMMPDDLMSYGLELEQAPKFVYAQFQARFYDLLKKQNIDQFTYSTVDSGTVFIQFIRALFPLLPIIITAILCYDALQEDKDSGVIKVLLTQPLPRKRYIRNKIRLNITSILCIFIVPLLIMSIGFGLFDHFKTVRAPVLSNVDGITSLQIMENTLPEIQQKGGSTGVIGITHYFSIPYQYGSPNVEFDFLELWQFTLLCLVMAVMVLIFFVLMNTLITVLVRNKIFALAISLAIMLCGIYIVQPSNTGPFYALLPFTYVNPVDIVSGYSSYTWLTGMLVLATTNIFLYVFTIQVYKRADVVC